MHDSSGLVGDSEFFKGETQDRNPKNARASAEKEAEESARKLRQRAEFDHKRRELEFAEAGTRARIAALQTDLERQRAELTSYFGEDDAHTASSIRREGELRRRRGGDPAEAPVRKSGNGSAK
jgi:hypothetical protein